MAPLLNSKETIDSIGVSKGPVPRAHRDKPEIEDICRPLSALVQKRTNASAVRLSAKCQKRTNAGAAWLSALCQLPTSTCRLYKMDALPKLAAYKKQNPG